MEDRRKTKKGLLGEIAELRQRVSILEEELRRNGERCREELSDQSCYDVLTGLPNRTPFYDFVRHAIAHASRRRQIVSVLFFSLDGFKLINESFGEETGNLLLKEVAERLKFCLRKSDILARPGWDEFIILLPEIARVEDATVVVERIFDTLQSPFRLNCRDLHINASIGISLFPHDGADPASLINNAYNAMKRAKEERKNDFRFYSPSVNSHAFKSLLMENSLRMAIKREEIFFQYQPKINIATGKITGMEALLRWTHPEMGAVAPDEFIPLMEEIGLTSSLSEWELTTACRYNRECRERGFHAMRISINLSSRQLHQKGLVATVSRVLSETGTDPDQLELEITEGDMVRNIESTSRTLRELSGMGVQIAIDDFGKGYSSLSYLRYFPLNKIKIDKVFIDGITTDRNNATISKVIVTLARSLELNVVAEGVEAVEQLDFLRALGCDEVQGYLFSHPLSAEESLRLLLEKRGYDMKSGKAAGFENCCRFWLDRRQTNEDLFPESVNS